MPFTAEDRPPSPPYWNLVAAGEPFRLLFPLGAVIGIIGVLMWPLYVWKFTTIYPGVAHSRIMIEGFLTCFVIGFLGTALPRLLEAPRITVEETAGFAVALSGVCFLHCSGNTILGDQLFFLTLAGLVFSLGVRFLFRKDMPPPALILVSLGILSALAGSAIQAISQIAPAALPGWVLFMGRLLLNQGYLLLPIMGIGAFLLPCSFIFRGRCRSNERALAAERWLSGCGSL